AIVAEPLQIHRPELGTTETRRLVREALERVGLPADASARLPGELSGGQQQRVGVARAIISRPRFVVLDEPTSSLDLSIRAQILALLAELQEDLGLAYLFVSHDMHTVEWVSDRVAVMYLGEFVEVGPTAQLFAQPSHGLRTGEESQMPDQVTIVDNESLPWVNGGEVFATMEPAFRDNLGDDPDRVQGLLSKYWMKQLWIDDSSRRI
ncbi:ABC transporter ATP-binding protein, partial [Nocardioides sp.]|uniref:ATP-binding cassette domain-containing protein n=1 Tax=Nocardioides sp. TaxID=35761 RepID=UPI0025F12C0B